MQSEYSEYVEKVEINARIDNLEGKLNLIIEKLEKIDSGNNKMNEHIDFINSVYVKIQIPLFWVCDKVNYMKGSKIENKDKLLNKSNVEEQD